MKLIIDADWTEHGWEIVLRQDQIAAAAWSGLSDEEVESDTFNQMVGTEIARALIQARVIR